MKTTLDALQIETLTEEENSIMELLSGIEGIALNDVMAKAKGLVRDEDLDDDDEEEEEEEDDFDNDFDDDDFNEDEIEDWD